jgi:hypothetical protein
VDFATGQADLPMSEAYAVEAPRSRRSAIQTLMIDWRFTP